MTGEAAVAGGGVDADAATEAATTLAVCLVLAAPAGFGCG